MFSLVEHVGHIPPYAILSHTWGADHDEVTFKDIVENTGQSKAGYKKLRFCGKQAANDGLQLFWVDTSCIDKSSSAELSEAINSMFQWYRKAVKCYAYLSDVSTTSPSQHSQSIQKSRWFTRGWTLQELVAPASVEFFSVEGHRLGDKHSLQQILHEITGIAIGALQGSPLSQFSVDERMSWVGRRETKRVEDAAYSLLGIFDIHMPLIYGEGREKAFHRLRREIKEGSEDAKTALSPISNVPFRRDPDFVDRGTLLNQVRTKCSVPSSCVALVGLGGVGKSQIAIEHSYRVREESPNTWVFWVHAGTQARFKEGYQRIAETTRMNGWNDPKTDILQLVRSWLCDQRNGQWTMIIDNGDDASVFSHNRSQKRGADSVDQSAEPLSDFLPQSPNGSILVTSRGRDVAYRLTGSHASIIEVKAMDENDALALLRKKLNSSIGKDDAVALLQALDYMPLAITQAAAFIEQRAPRVTISRYLDELCTGDHNRARLLKKDVGDSRRDGRASNSIIATWQISFEHIRRQRPTAARLLSLMSLFDGQGIPESLLHDRYGGDEDGEADFDDDIHTLTSFSLVKMSADGREFEMHQLVQFSMKKWLELNQELELWQATYATLMDDSYPVGLHENWPVCQALFPHAQTVANNQPNNAKTLKSWASVLFKAAWYASEMGQYSKAYEMGSAAYRVRETILGAEHPDTLNSLNSLGLVLDWQGQYSEAEAMHQRALETKERVFGPDHPDTLTSMANLALTYGNQGRWKDAEELEVQVMETRKTKLGADHPNTLTSMANLALTYGNQGRWKDAEELEVQVMETRKTKLGADHPNTLTSMGNLASTYKNQGRWKDAEELDVQVIETSKTKLGADHPDTLTSMGNLASTYWNQGRWKDAEELDVQVMETRKTKLGADHPNTLTSMGNLASTYKNQGRWKDAEELEVQVMETRKTKLGADHPDTLTSMDNLASTYGNQGRWKDAEELEVQVIETSKTKLGADHPDTLTSMANLASTYWNQGRWKDAEELEVQVMETRKTKLGADHPNTLTSMANLASTYWNQGRWKDAEELDVQVVEMSKTKLGADHPNTLSSIANLASTYKNQGRWKDAEELEVQVMETRETKLGADHPDTLTSMANLASTYRNQGWWKDAEQLDVQVMETRKTKLGADHPDTLTSMNNLAFTWKGQGRHAEAIDLMRECVQLQRRILGVSHPHSISSSTALAGWEA
ncbi:TPR-like protein [Zopfia rhizophila CBS 207.26]|uniref:TPR-like protein n=1 Tax=Zopfia rhizophila CBS 207.26 TaxID=1314779 RepID=A0A6A6ETM3_9PEZI|nr:TPR-like protein [Zopfia rhizophila CBS 207.26]